MLLLCASISCEGGFQHEWHPYIVQLIDQHHQQCLSPVINGPPTPCKATQSTVGSSFSEVIVWDPIRPVSSSISGRASSM